MYIKRDVKVIYNNFRKFLRNCDDIILIFSSVHIQ